MKNLIKPLICIFTVCAVSIFSLSANTVKSLRFTAVTKTEKVVINIDAGQKRMEYLTPSKDYNYTILDYDYSANPDEKSYIFRGTVLDTLLNTASEVTIYSNGTFTDMRIGRRQIVFTYVEELTVK